MGNNCCSSEQPDAQDNRVDVMLEFMPRETAKKHKSLTNRHEIRTENTSTSFLIPVKRSKRSDYSKGSNGSRPHHPTNDDPFRLNTRDTKKLSEIMRL